ncbi:MAG: type II toxin-antitoxin system HicA family toxin [Nitrospirota bacterium]
MLGFSNPEPGSRHFYMRYGEYTLTIPNNPEYSVPQIKVLLQELSEVLEKEITVDEWHNL